MNTIPEWKQKAHKVIKSLCQQSYLHKNTNSDGSIKRKHAQYSVPHEALQLIKCLNADDEEKAKAIFLFNYNVSKL